MATRPADNPVGVMAKKLHFSGLARDAPKLSLPGKLVFPSMHNVGHFSMLGLGDIVSFFFFCFFLLIYDDLVIYWLDYPHCFDLFVFTVVGDARSASLFRTALRCLQEVAVAPLGRNGRATAQSSQSNHVSRSFHPINQTIRTP